MTSRITGWLVFASTITVVLGAFNVILGLAALFNDDVFVTSDGQLLVFDFTAWGIIHLVWGIVIVGAGFALLTKEEWARWLALFAVALNAIAHIAFFVAFPLWSLVMIALDVLVVYALAARWDED